MEAHYGTVYVRKVDSEGWNSILNWALAQLSSYRVDFPASPGFVHDESTPVRFGYEDVRTLPGCSVRSVTGSEIYEGDANPQSISLLARICRYPLDDEGSYALDRALMSFYLTTHNGTIVAVEWFAPMQVLCSDEATLSEMLARTHGATWDLNAPQAS